MSKDQYISTTPEAGETYSLTCLYYLHKTEKKDCMEKI